MTIPMMLTVRSDFPARDVAEFVALAKKRAKPLQEPGSLSGCRHQALG
jgi:tripartite-type tricarboxylate transporter receptor subunit TctC